MDLNLARCPRCSRLFQTLKYPVCDRCETDEEQDYEQVRAVLAKHQEMDAREVSERAGVTLECVLRMLSQGMLSGEDLHASAECGRCGKPAISLAKRLCHQCLATLDVELTQTMSELTIRLDPPRARGDAQHVHTTVQDKRK
jgi:transposase